MKPTARQLSELLDREADLTIGDGLIVACRILDVRECYGTLQYRVTPLCGDGERWVTAARCTVRPPAITRPDPRS